MFKVVVVEDEELLRMGLTGFFDWKGFGFELAGEAGNGEKGLEVVRAVKPDLVITDIKMPHMDGIEMTEILKQEMPDLQILIISGYDEFEYAKRALKAGVSEYILKPIKMDDLKEAVGKMHARLTKQKSEKEELEQLKSSHQENTHARRSSVYEKLLLRGASVQDVQDRLSQDERGKVYLAGIISLLNFSVLYMDCDYSLVMEKDQALGRTIETCLQQVYDDAQIEKTEILRIGNGERLICICGDSREETAALQHNLEVWISAEKPEMEPLDVTFGQPMKGLEGLAGSYRTARKRSEDKFLRGWQDAARQPEGTKKVSFLSYDVSNLCYEIKSGTEQSVRKEMSVLKETLSSGEISSYLQLVLVVSNVYYELIRIPEEAGGRIEDVVADVRVYYQQLIGRMKREEMLTELESFCLKLHAYYQQLSGDRKREVMQRVDAYVKDHFSQEDLAMKDVAEHAYISVSYLGMIIKKETGKTFTEYLTDIRVEKAKQMLSSTGMKNYEIAQACGYTTPAYFSTVFKGTVGMTPTEYRNALKSGK